MSTKVRSNIAPPAQPKTVVTDGQPAAPVKHSPDVLRQLDAASNTDANSGHTFQIEIVPDFRFPLLSWIFSMARLVPNSAYLSSAYASPASLLGYITTMYVGFLYHTDSAHLLRPSAAALAISDSSLYSRFFDMLLDLPVPNFADSEFESLRAFAPDDIPALIFLSCLASSSFFHDLGRHFPASTWFALHNLVAGLPGNTTTGALRQKFYSSIVATVNLPGNAAAQLTPAHLFGRVSGDSVVSNWLNERIDALTNAMSIRAVNQFNVVAQINFPQVAIADAAAYNPYTFLAALDTVSTSSVSSAMQHLASWVETSFPNSHTLRHYLQPGSNETVNYLSLDVAYPTWFTTIFGNIDTDAKRNALARLVAPDSTPSAIATAFRFLVTPTVPADADVDGNSVFNAAIPRAADPAPASPHYNILTNNTARANPYVNPITYLAFDAARHYMPNCLIFAPYVTSVASLDRVIVAGKIIESGDISGIMVSVPTNVNGLLYENSMFHEGAIRITRTRQALFHANVDVSIEPRVPRTTLNAAIAFFRGMSSGFRSTALRAGPVRTPTARNGPSGRALPGAQIVIDAPSTADAINVFGRDLEHDLQLHASTVFNVWSSFRFRYAAPAGPVIYVLPTLRHIFGARARNYGTVHPASRLPL